MIIWFVQSCIWFRWLSIIHTCYFRLILLCCFAFLWSIFLFEFLWRHFILWFEIVFASNSICCRSSVGIVVELKTCCSWWCSNKNNGSANTYSQAINMTMDIISSNVQNVLTEFCKNGYWIAQQCILEYVSNLMALCRIIQII